MKDLRNLERAMGFEPTTASLEGWNSTIELHPQTACDNTRRMAVVNSRQIAGDLLDRSSTQPNSAARLVGVFDFGCAFDNAA